MYVCVGVKVKVSSSVWTWTCDWSTCVSLLLRTRQRYFRRWCNFTRTHTHTLTHNIQNAHTMWFHSKAFTIFLSCHIKLVSNYIHHLSFTFTWIGQINEGDLTSVNKFTDTITLNFHLMNLYIYLYICIDIDLDI